MGVRKEYRGYPGTDPMAQAVIETRESPLGNCATADIEFPLPPIAESGKKVL